ncbi:MAG: endonuclease III [Sandaracinus sp.]|nr:endonuclease III [Sandaracinus sp.]
MKPAEKATRIGEQLDALYPEPPIPLDHTDPFTLLIAVMLSAQTTDKKVNQVTPALFEAGPTPKAMAALPAERILELIKEVGLAPTKAKNVKRSAELLVERHAGVVPRTLDELEALPGVGHKTAQVVLAQAFEIPAFPVDTHIHRLAERWGLSSGKNVDTTEKDLKALFPEDTWIRRHLQIIYFGREHCPARGHDPKVCPICSWAAPKDVTSSDTKKDSKPAKASKPGAKKSAESAAPKKAAKKASATPDAPKKAAKKASATPESAAPKKAAKKATTAKGAGRKSS